LEGVRINKYLSEIGFCSRREADRMIENGRVKINGRKPAIGAKVTKRDKVFVDGQLVSGEIEEDVYIAFNKPVGIVSTTDPNERDNIVDYISHHRRIFPIGRLDKLSEGLIFLTSDGDIVNKILRARNNHEKEYVVTVDKPIDDAFIQKMGNGIPIMGSMTRKCKVERISTYVFSITLTQGMNRQIRRMCEYLGYEVQRLKRVRIMNIALDVGEGQWRDLTADEMKEIQLLVADSAKTQKSKPKKQNPSAKKTQDSKPKARSSQNSKPHRKKTGSFSKSKGKQGSKSRSGKPASRGRRR